MNIEQTQDKLVNSPICNSNACYESEFQTQDGIVKTWLCMTSGYTSNTTMVEGSEALKKATENTSVFILSKKQVHDGLAWFPTCITMPDKGMIFPEPHKEEEWKWTVVKAIPVPEEDQEKYPIPSKPGEFYKTKMDMENLKRFDKLCFMDAAEELGMFGKLPKPESSI